MKRFYLLGFLALMLFDTLAQVSFKLAALHAGSFRPDVHWLSSIFSHHWIYGAFAGYIGAFFTWMTLLKYAPVGPAFAASHLEIISVTLVSVWLFDENLTWHGLAGGLLILIGICCLARAEALLPVAPTDDADV